MRLLFLLGLAQVKYYRLQLQFATYTPYTYAMNVLIFPKIFTAKYISDVYRYVPVRILSTSQARSLAHCEDCQLKMFKELDSTN